MAHGYLVFGIYSYRVSFSSGGQRVRMRKSVVESWLLDTADAASQSIYVEVLRILSYMHRLNMVRINDGLAEVGGCDSEITMVILFASSICRPPGDHTCQSVFIGNITSRK